MRTLILDRTKALADREWQATFPGYKAIEVPSDIESLSDADLFALYESLFERRVSIDSAPQC
jgi:hypothetical protein